MENTLDKLPLNHKGIIKSLKLTGTIRRRLLDLGLVKGTYIIPVLISPSKGLKAFYVRASIIALRDEDASLIEISF